MSHTVERVWHPPGQRSRSYRAFVPDLLAESDWNLTSSAHQQSEQAAIDLARADTYLPVAWQPIARMLLRAEGVASSDIEGLRVTPRRVLEASHRPSDTIAQWVAGNLEALDYALGTSHRRLSGTGINEWHRRLMKASPIPDRYVGRLRKEQGWIGGTSPVDAVYVPPAPELLPDLMVDLIGFCNRLDLPAVVQAAVAHAQFETIHPYGDGNGRTGRILIDWILRRRQVVKRAIPPLSLVIARRPDDYVVGLHQFRQGDVEEWVKWFARVCVEAGALIGTLVTEVGALLERWESLIGSIRSDATARKLIEVLPGTPLIDAATAAELVGVSTRAALSALTRLEEIGILEAVDLRLTERGRPPRRWLAADLLGLLG